MATVTIENVTKYYYGRKETVLAVDGINLEIRDGELMVFLGPSGCGKSTTMKMIAGLEKISDGKIYIGDRIVNDLTPNQRNIAMAFETYALYTHLPARENLAFCLRAKGLKGAEIDGRVNEIARLLHLEDIMDKRPSELSGGHQQRLSLGRALIRNPTLFLLDEPLSHLDAKLRVSIRTEIRRIHSSLDTTMLYVTHDQNEALALADRITLMNFGEIQQVGTTDDLFFRPANIFVATFLGEPAMNIVDADVRRTNGSLEAVSESLGTSFPIPKSVAARIEEQGIERLKLGLRPFDIRVLAASATDRDGMVPISGTVNVWEFLGERNIVTTEHPNAKLVSAHGEQYEFEEGGAIQLGIARHSVYYFDHESEVAIR